ncbi:uncharacterized protein C2orf81 homolog [Strix uralensis]|uniref:uncharacterized protein C2orf81 homolog n=1 Tax=Strix uralensis TaxID=36305 RepID=UPI003DA7A03E
MATAARRDDVRAARRDDVSKMTPRERAAAPKPRGDKSRPPTVTTGRVATSPGHLPAGEWLPLLEAERGDRDVGDVVAELLGCVLDACARAHATRGCVPWAVGWARDTLLQMVAGSFPARDEGETDPERGHDDAWREDEEPQPPPADSWARGSVPVLTPGLGEVSGSCAPCQCGKQNPPAGAPPAQPPCPGQVPSASTILPVPGTSSPELPPAEAATVPRPPQGKPLAPCPPPGPAEPRGRPERGRRRPRSSRGDAEGSGVAGGRVPPPPPSCTSPGTMRPGRPPRSTAAKRGGSGTVLGGPGSRPRRWITPQVEVLDPEAKAPACPRGTHRHSRAPELGSRRPPRGPVTTGGSPLPPMPRQLGSLLGSAQPAPGVTLSCGGSERHQPCAPAPGEEEEEEEEEEKEDPPPPRGL